MDVAELDAIAGLLMLGDIGNLMVEGPIVGATADNLFRTNLRGGVSPLNVKRAWARRKRMYEDTMYRALDKQERGTVDAVKYENFKNQLYDLAEDTAVDVVGGLTYGYGLRKGIKKLRGAFTKRKLTPMKTLRRIYQSESPDDGDLPPLPDDDDFDLEPRRLFGTEPIEVNIGMATFDPKGPKLKSDPGASMLQWKNDLTRMYHTHLWYSCSPIKAGKKPTGDTVTNHYTFSGNGPNLYWQYEYGLTGTGIQYRKTNFGDPKNWDGGMSSITQRALGAAGVVYVFAADWPFKVMNHDTATQRPTDATALTEMRERGRLLEWENFLYDSNTDPNSPINVSDFIQKVGWQYLTVYSVQYSFQFTNISLQPYCVEVLMFKFKADPDAMNYEKQVKAVWKNQNWGMSDYVKENGFWIPSDITIISRRRFMLKGLQNNAYLDNTNSWSLFEGARENTFTYNTTVSRQYVMKRPIVASYNAMTEVEFFNTYYEPDKGIYCRLSAWPKEPFYVQSSSADNPKVEIKYQNTTDPEETIAGTKLMPGVMVEITKKGSFKFDESIINA